MVVMPPDNEENRPFLSVDTAAPAKYNSLDDFEPRTSGSGLCAWATFSIIAGSLYGYNCSLAAVLPTLASRFHWSTTGTEVASAVSTSMEAISALFLGGPLLDRIGRRPTGLMAGVLSVLGALMTCFIPAPNSESTVAVDFPSQFFIFCRACTGVGNGLCILVLPVYICESVRRDQRGMLVSMFQGGVMLGTLLPYVVNILSLAPHETGAEKIMADPEWKLTLAMGALPGACILACFLVFPRIFAESKYWALAGERSPEAFFPLTPPLPAQPQSGSHTFAYLMLGILLAYANNSVDVFLYYGPVMLETLGETGWFSQQFGAFVCVLSIIGIIGATILLSGGCERRKLLLTSFAVLIVCYLSGSLFSYLHFEHPVCAWDKVMVLISLSGIVLSYNLGPGPMVLLILSELFPNARRRGRLVGICTFFLSFFAMIMNSTMMSLFDSVGIEGTLLLYGLSYVFCWLIFYVYLPETINHSMD